MTSRDNADLGDSDKVESTASELWEEKEIY